MTAALRKSTRARTMTAKATNTASVRRPETETEPIAKKPRVENVIMSEDSNKIDPVEKLLSLTNINTDFLTSLEEVHHEEEEQGKSNELMPLNFTKILNDSIRRYYANAKRNNMAIYNENFALLNSRERSLAHDLVDTPELSFTHSPPAPFFKNVNFNSVAKSSSTSLDEYFSYDEDESPLENKHEQPAQEEVSSPLSVEEDEEDPKSNVPAKIVTPKLDEQPQQASPVSLSITFGNKMSFRYRQNHNNLNLSLHCNTHDNTHDLFKILNKHSILTGKASEMVSNGGFLINDFFL